MQPAYLPWLGYFDRIEMSDIMIYLDDVFLDTNSKTNFINRNKINTAQGPIWLTVPIKRKNSFSLKKIKEYEVVQDNWMKKHLKTIDFNYKNTEYFNLYYDQLKEIYYSDWDNLVDLIYRLNNFFLNILNINTEIHKASEFNIEEVKNDYILNLCKEKKAEKYISGIFGKNYLNQEQFEKEKIQILFHDYLPLKYRQNFKGFSPYLSVLDVLFNCGPDSLEIIKSGRNIKL
jgi:hypothetical protein